MILYSYSHEGEHAGSFDAPIDPLETEKAGQTIYLHPARSTDIAPPQLTAKQAAIWNGSGWDVVADHRGETWWTADGRPMLIGSLGDPSSELSPVEPPKPPAPKLPVTKLQLVRALRDIGLKPAFDAALAAATVDLREDWDLAISISRSDPLMTVLKAAWMDDATIDALYDLAAQQLAFRGVHDANR